MLGYRLEVSIASKICLSAAPLKYQLLNLKSAVAEILDLLSGHVSVYDQRTNNYPLCYLTEVSCPLFEGPQLASLVISLAHDTAYLVISLVHDTASFAISSAHNTASFVIS